MNTRRLSALAIAATIFAAACSPGRDGAVTSTISALHQDLALGKDANVVEARVPNNATFDSLLRQHDVSSTLAMSVITAVRSVFDPRNLRANQPYRIRRGLDGLIREFQYQIDAERLLRVIFKSAVPAASPVFDVSIETTPKEVELDTVSASISREQSSLVAALEHAGENVTLALSLAEVFGGEVDFNADLQPNDQFEVLFERMTQRGEHVGYGNVVAAVLVHDKKRLTAIRYVGADGQANWYDEQGRSLKRQFLRSPLQFDPRITSGFSYRRLHPVNGGYRPHLGVDYGAPYGAPVIAVADGVVTEAGFAGEAGRMVRLRHTGGYETAYLHLSAFAPGIRVGTRVTQGQIIARVGNSGTVTGTHLDYRIRKNGVYVNPLAELARMPKGASIDAAAMPAFGAERDRALAQLTEGLAHQTKPAATASHAAAPRGQR